MASLPGNSPFFHARARPAALRLRHEAETAAERLPPLLAAAERVAATVAQGVHGRRRVGQGDAFWQFRGYQPGDTPTQVDWRRSGRADRLFVRQNEWEAAQSVWLWRDGSGSMDYASRPELPTKQHRADVLLLALSILLTRAGERVALMTRGDGRAQPASGTTAVHRVALGLAQAGTGALADDVPPAVAIPRFSQTVLISDWLTPLDAIAAAVRRVSAQGARGHLLQVLDPAEETLPFAGRVQLLGCEGEAPLLAPRVENLRDRYRERLALQRDGLADIARATGWSFAVHHTDKPPHLALLGLWGALSRQLQAAAGP